MIELYDIIEAMNSYLTDGMFVLHRSMKVHSKFKVYKIFCYNLYHVTKDNKVIVLSYEETKNAPSDSIKEVWLECDKLYLRKLVKWLSGDEFKTLTVNGI